MIQMAHNLEMTACAAGVENQEILDFLGAVGCDKFQGFFICRPVPAPEFE
jgi:EAL domain-containing protein (putative c-di-GMP-specific phosphodiesterase class I)